MNNIFDSPEIQELIDEHGEERIKKILLKRKSFTLYFDNFPNLDSFTDAQAGILFKNIFAFEKMQDLKEMDQYMNFAFSFIEARLINGFVEYISKCITNSENGVKGVKAKAEKSNEYPTKEKFVNHFVSLGKDREETINMYDLFSKDGFKNFDWKTSGDLIPNASDR